MIPAASRTTNSFLGTGSVTVFLFMTYPDQPLVLVLATMITVLDISYILLLLGRRAAEHRSPRGALHERVTPAALIENAEHATA